MVFLRSPDSAESWLIAQGWFFFPGSAIAYSAYVFPDALVNTVFHDYYVALAVLNTSISTGLSCYSRYPAALSQMGWGAGRRGAHSFLDCWKGQWKRRSGAWDSVPGGLPVAGQDQLHRHTPVQALRAL